MTKERKTEEKFAKESDTFRAYAGKKRMIFAVFTVILLALIAGIGIYNTPANRLARQIDLGRKYFTSTHEAAASASSYLDWL